MQKQADEQCQSECKQTSNKKGGSEAEGTDKRYARVERLTGSKHLPASVQQPCMHFC